MSEIVVIMPCLNVAATLPRQLEALDRQTDLAFRVVVADNGSQDATVRIAEEWTPRFEGIDVVDASMRRGVAFARNVGIDSSSEPLILICDGDDRVHEKWVEAMRAALREADAVTGPLQTITNGVPGVLMNPDGIPVAMRFRPYLPGGNLGVRREVIDEIGGFDPDLDLGQEDVDFGWRLHGAGRSMTHAPEAVIDYYQRSTLRLHLRQQYRYGRAYAALYAKHCDIAPPPVSTKTSLRWFWEWVKQYRVRDGLMPFGAPAFQVGRLRESRRRGVATPL